MERFKIVRKGYERTEVDDFVERKIREYEDTLAKQKERIDMLKMELSLREKELEKYKEKESEISEVLFAAIDRAKEMDYTAKIRFTLEGERIKIFKSKWMSYCDKHCDNLELSASRNAIADYLDAMDREIAKVMERDINMKSGVHRTAAEQDYISESERNRGFNLDDLDNPPPLRSICEELEDGEGK